jgi:hypothetical protein
MRTLGTLWLALVTVGALRAQDLPKVTAYGGPLYPALARQARIQGEVQLEVTTDGTRVVGSKVLGGHPLLVKAADENVQTWTFIYHEPLTFTVVFRYRTWEALQPDVQPIVTLRLPTEVEITTPPPQIGGIVVRRRNDDRARREARSPGGRV